MIFTREEQEENLARQRKASTIALFCLREDGVGPADQRHLVFRFESLSREALLKLKSFLEKETDYRMRVHETKGEYALTGRTPSTLLSLKVLDDWVLWMCMAGAACDALFEGWSASKVSTRRPLRRRATPRPTTAVRVRHGA